MRSPLARFLTAVAATLVLAGCTAAEPGQAASSTPAASTPSVSAEPTDETTPVDDAAEPAEAEMAFAGDCAQVLTDADLGAIAAAAWTLTDAGGPDPASALAGALSCRWDGAGAGVVSVDILPLSLVSDEALATPDIVACPDTEGPDLCMAELAVGDSWLIAGAGTEDALSAVVGRVGARLIGQRPVAAPLPAGSWALPDCSVIVDAVRASGMSDAEAGVQNDSQPYGPLWDTLAGDGRAGWCGAHQPEQGGISIALYPGGADQGSEPSGEEFDVDGADQGWITRDDAGLSTGVLDAGVNRLTFATSGFLASQDDLLAKILSVLTERTDL
ncbi:hypothetical protein [Microbacterium sp. ZW T5_56]|uniref:hypothetical protein n=1 Tax=Microbacterium sp. ZW T5_56 TaxID=3378081 RepID=UPI003852D656